jgi:hypothetical protein
LQVLSSVLNKQPQIPTYSTNSGKTQWAMEVPSRLNSKGKGRAPQNGDILALNLDSAEEGTASENGGAFQQMQLVEQQVCDH